jgi:hypothetical protein
MKFFELNPSHAKQLAGDRVDSIASIEYAEEGSKRVYASLLALRSGSGPAALVAFRLTFVRDDRLGMHRIELLAEKLTNRTVPWIQDVIQLPYRDHPTPVNADPIAFRLALERIEERAAGDLSG